MKNKIGVIVLQLAGLAWFGLSAKAHAVVPPPDGSYPGFNTAEGQNALFNLTTGSLNTAVSKALPLQRLCCVPQPRLRSE